MPHVNSTRCLSTSPPPPPPPTSPPHIIGIACSRLRSLTDASSSSDSIPAYCLDNVLGFAPNREAVQGHKLTIVRHSVHLPTIQRRIRIGNRSRAINPEWLSNVHPTNGRVCRALDPVKLRRPRLT